MPWQSRHDDSVELDALHQGVPAWMERPLLLWAREVTNATYRNQLFETRQQPNVELLQEYETARRARVSHIIPFRDEGIAALYVALGKEGFLDFVDFLVYKLGASGQSGAAKLAALELVLSDAGSEWKVGRRRDFASLERRVPGGVSDAIEAIIEAPGHAGTLLAEAWNAAFGRAPDYEKAYSKAVKAVEAAAIPVVSPAHVAATLGTVIAQMRDQGNWKLQMSREHATYSTDQVVLGVMQALWTGQNDRHAGQPGYTPSTQADAEAGVILAVPLVQWFSSGAIARR